MPPPLGLVNLSVGDLIAAAGGDPWKVNDELQAGDPGAINGQADAFHTAAGSATEVEDDFKSAKQRLETGWKHNGAEHPINESAQVTRATTTLHLQKSQLGKIALDLETVAAALATAQRTCDGDIAALDNFLHGIDDAMSTAKSANQDTKELHDAAVAAVRTTLGEIQDSRSGYAATMKSAEASMAPLTGEAPTGAGVSPAPTAGGTPTEQSEHPGEGTSLVPTTGDLAVGGAGAIAGGTADGVRGAALDAIKDGPKTGPGAAEPGLLRWLEDPKVAGFSRVSRVIGAAGAVPAVISDVHNDHNSVVEAVTREAAGTGAGLYLGSAAGSLAAGAFAGSEMGAAIGSVIPGAGTAVGLVAGAVVGAGASYLASKGIEMSWNPVKNAIGSVAHSVESIFDFG